MRIIFVLLLGASVAAAQSVMGTSGTTTNIVTVTNSPPIATVSLDGRVAINWRETEKIAADPAYWNKELLSYARLMIAIRDHTYTNLDQPENQR